MESQKPRKCRAHSHYEQYLLLLFLAMMCLSLYLNNGSTLESYDGSSHRYLSTSSKSTHSGRSDYSKYSCEDIYRHPLDAASQCTFATTCNDGEGILMGHFIFCSNQDHQTIDTDTDANDSDNPPTRMSRTLLLWLVCSPLALLLILLFRILGSTAEEFFSPGLEMLSLRLGLPERFAGVTLLALGNGAPDVASTVSAIRNDHKRGYLLALGELTGTCMVLSTVVVGVVAYVSPRPVPCRASLVRDVIMFIITMILVFLAFHDGSIHPREIRSFVGLYVAYVLIVLSADIYHRKFVAIHNSISTVNTTATVQQQEAEEQEKTTNNNHNKDEDTVDKQQQQTAFVTSETTPLMETGPNPTINNVINDNETSMIGGAPSPTLVQRMMRFFTNYNDDEDDDEDDDDVDIPEGEGQAELDDKKPISNNKLQPQTSGRNHSHRSSSGWGERDGTGHEPLMVFHPHHGGMVDLKHLESAGSSGGSFHTDGDKDDHDHEEKQQNKHHPHYHQHHDDHWLEVRYELREYFNNFLDSIYRSSDYNCLDKALMTSELPLTFLRMLSIPVPCDGYYCRPLLALSVTLSPCWVGYYLYDQFDVNILEQSTTTIAVVVAIPLAIGLLILRFAPKGNIPPRPLAAVPITLIGFVVSATWLDLIADKLVKLLTFFAIICHIPSTIMGLTILAWGNSSQDLIANMTVARKDLSIMAITASFAGPVFNILVGLGIGFAILTNSLAPGESIPVHLDNPLRIGFLFSVLNGVLVIASGVCFGRGFIPPKYGYVAMIVYSAYVVVSITI